MIFDEGDITVALQRFNDIAQTLVEKGIPGDVEDARRAINSDGDFTLVLGNTRMARETDRYPNGRNFELSFILVRDVSLGNKG